MNGLKSMALSAEAAKDMYTAVPSGEPGDAPRYPYGLGLSLRDESLKALGLTTMPSAGQTLMISARVKVTGVHQDERQDGVEQSLELQITDMEIGPDVAPKSHEAKLYGDASDAGA